METQRRKVMVALLSVISNTTLVILKLIVGVIIGSVSVISEAIHSFVDLIAAVIALFAVKTAHKPADREHPYGHGKVENISGAVEALLIFVAAGWIIFEAIKKLLHPSGEMMPTDIGIVVMLISAVSNQIVSQMLFKVGKETDSVALQADGWHLRTDVYTSAGVMLGLAIIWFGRAVFSVNLGWLDPIIAIAVALLIVKAAYDLTRQSVQDLLDASLPVAEQAWIANFLRQPRPSVHGLHHLRTRKAGATRFVEFHLLVDAEMSVENSHQIAEELTAAIEQQYPATSVTVHIEPCDGHCTPHCAQGCFLAEGERPCAPQGQA